MRQKLLLASLLGFVCSLSGKEPHIDELESARPSVIDNIHKEEDIVTGPSGFIDVMPLFPPTLIARSLARPKGMITSDLERAIEQVYGWHIEGGATPNEIKTIYDALGKIPAVSRGGTIYILPRDKTVAAFFGKVNGRAGKHDVYLVDVNAPTVVHEFTHVIEQRLRNFEEQWQGTHQFEYGKKIKVEKDKYLWTDTPENGQRNGFVEPYGRVNFHEDAATLAGKLYSPGGMYPDLFSITNEDAQILRRKIGILVNAGIVHTDQANDAYEVLDSACNPQRIEADIKLVKYVQLREFGQSSFGPFTFFNDLTSTMIYDPLRRLKDRKEMNVFDTMRHAPSFHIGKDGTSLPSEYDVVPQEFLDAAHKAKNNLNPGRYNLGQER